MPEQQLSSSHNKTGFISLPGTFFTQTVPRIQDLAELKVALYVAYLVLRKQDHPHFVTYKELKAESCRLSDELGGETFRQALDSAVEHGTLLHSTLNIDGTLEDVYSLTVGSHQPPTVNIFAIYEQNIGMITPIIAEELRKQRGFILPSGLKKPLR